MAETETTNTGQVKLSGRGLAAPNTGAANWPKTVFALLKSNTVDLVLDLTASSFYDEKIAAVAKYIRDSQSQSISLAIANLLDLNIVPLNVNALMRDITLVNIYNYAYSFDRMIIDIFYGIGSAFGDAFIQYLCRADSMLSTMNHNARGPIEDQGGHNESRNKLIKSSKDFFILMMLNPYRKIIMQQTAGGFKVNPEMEFLARSIIGDSNLQLERAKFVSDQIWNKALFRDVPGSVANQVERRLLEHGPRYDDIPADALVYLDQSNYNDNENDTEFALNYAAAQVPINANVKKLLQTYGFLRLQTVLVRDLMFLVNCYRIIRYKLQQDLTYDKSEILSKFAVTRPDNTEFIRNQSMPRPNQRVAAHNKDMNARYIEQ
jgi:hypothetical protein